MAWKEWRPPSVETDTIKIGTSMSRLAKSLGVGDLSSFDELKRRWQEIAGDDFSPHMHPGHIENGVLYVRIPEHSWRSTLKWVAPKLLEAINREIPKLEIVEIKSLKET